MKKRVAPGAVTEVRRQFGALPFRYNDFPEVMLITSRETRRWVIPKGWPMKGKSPHGAAALEALQEAGIRGTIEKRPIGAYSYLKRGLGGQSWPCLVEVYPLVVRTELENWRERRQRTRQWYSYLDAAWAVDEPELRSLILAFGLTLEGP